MPFKTFISKINWRQILLHAIAACFVAYSFQTFFCLYGTHLINAIRNNYYGDDFKHFLITHNYNAGDLLIYWEWILISATIGLFTAFIISFIISIKRRWLWLNSLFAFIIVLMLKKFTALGWPYVTQVFWKPGKLFHNTVAELSINGSILLLMGLFIFFSKRSNNFIVAHYPTITT